MTTPIIVLMLLTFPYLGVRLWNRIGSPSASALGGSGASAVSGGRRVDPALGAVVGLSFAFVFFGVGHFALTESMTAMLPPWVPQRTLLIYITGALEWTLAVLLLTRWRVAAAWACIAMFVSFFPANVYAAFTRVDLGGHAWGPVYLLIRAPLQLILIGWTYWFAARRPRHE